MSCCLSLTYVTHTKSSEVKLLPLKGSNFSVMNLICFPITLVTATLETFTVCACIPLEQYTCTKQSWMEDYCKQDEEVNVISLEDWMGSSVDPPCFGQSMILINHILFQTVLTYRVICLMYCKHKYLVFIAYNELLQIFGKKKDKNAIFLFNCVQFFRNRSLPAA